MRLVRRPLDPGAARLLTPAEDEEWRTVKHEPLTREDWLDLINTLEDFKRRRIARHLQAKAEQ
jgi:hypothetical protein